MQSLHKTVCCIVLVLTTADWTAAATWGWMATRICCTRSAELWNEELELLEEEEEDEELEDEEEEEKDEDDDVRMEIACCICDCHTVSVSPSMAAVTKLCPWLAAACSASALITSPRSGSPLLSVLQSRKYPFSQESLEFSNSAVYYRRECYCRTWGGSSRTLCSRKRSEGSRRPSPWCWSGRAGRGSCRVRSRPPAVRPARLDSNAVVNTCYAFIPEMRAARARRGSLVPMLPPTATNTAWSHPVALGRTPLPRGRLMSHLSLSHNPTF